MVFKKQAIIFLYQQCSSSLFSKLTLHIYKCNYCHVCRIPLSSQTHHLHEHTYKNNNVYQKPMSKYLHDAITITLAYTDK